MFKLGDKVKALNDPIEGKVVKIEGKTVYVDFDGFDYPFQEKELIKIGDDNSVEFKTQFFSLKEEKTKQKWAKLEGKARDFIPKRNSYKVIEVDLHVQAIIDYYPDLTRENALKIQLFHAEKWVNWCLHKSENKLVLIHGVGEGILKDALIEKFGTGLNYKIEPAMHKLYGFGAMEIYLL
jgi:hypothetical protein